MMRILSTRNENKYYDDKATCGREQAFIIAKREVNSPSPGICGSIMTDTVRALQRKLKMLRTSRMFQVM